MQLALRVDVDTKIGLCEGVPRLLELFKRYSVKASFFVTFGPDRSGMAIRRLIRPSFVLKMLRTNPFRLYGFKTLLTGTLLPAQPVGEGEPAMLKDIVGEGHELGIHGYDHVGWQDGVEAMEEREIEGEFSRALGAYEKIMGERPECSAAPGWRCTYLALAAQDRFGFLYASDVRGRTPFLPAHGGLCFGTLQLPTTLPTLDELLGRRHDVNGHLLSLLNHDFNLHTIHAEVEGRPYIGLFEELLKECMRRRVAVVRLREVADEILEGRAPHPPRLPVVHQKIPGRSGWVACQGEVD